MKLLKTLKALLTITLLVLAVLAQHKLEKGTLNLTRAEAEEVSKEKVAAAPNCCLSHMQAALGEAPVALGPARMLHLQLFADSVRDIAYQEVTACADKN